MAPARPPPMIPVGRAATLLLAPLEPLALAEADAEEAEAESLELIEVTLLAAAEEIEATAEEAELATEEAAEEALETPAAASAEVMKYVWTAGGRPVNQAGGVGPLSSEEMMDAASGWFVKAIAMIELGTAAKREAVACAGSTESRLTMEAEAAPARARAVTEENFILN